MTEIQPQTTNSTTGVQNPPTVQSGGLLNNWKVKAGLIGAALVLVMVSLFIVTFFWQHWVAGLGMRSWSSQAGAKPIECMIKDSNNDGYVSCSAMLKGEVVPLECGATIFNIGCRVNYGSAAAPVVRPSKLP